MRLFKRFLQFVQPYRAELVLAFVIVVVYSVLLVASGWVFGHLVEEFRAWTKYMAENHSRLDADLFTHGMLNDALLWGCAVIGITLLRSACSTWRAVVAGSAAQRVVFDIRNHLVDHLTELSLRFYETYPTGQLMSRATSDVDGMQLLVTSATVDLLSDITQALILACVLTWISPRLMLTALLLGPLLFGATAYFGRRMRRVSREVQAQLAVVSAQLLETISGIRVVMGFSAEKRERERFRVANAEALRLGIRRLWIQNVWSASAESGIMIAMIVLAVAAIREIVQGRMDVGEATMFTTLLVFLPMPLQRLAIFNDTFQRGMAATERVFEILDTPAEVFSSTDAVDAGRVNGHVRLENVSFAYDHGQIVLENANLEIPAGATVALVGPSGAGKSTTANLLARFYDPTEGRVLADGRDIREFTLDSWRRQIGLVLQETFLFSGTARDNIALGRPNATDEEIRAAAIAANADEFLDRLPNGLDTEVGERGVKLSGGQRQRIAIARAILRDPPILVLDEATSSLDSEAERLIQSALDRLLQGRTALVIAHRLSTVRQADKIVVLDGGCVVEQGTHDELMERNGLYARLYHTQFEAPPSRRPYVEPDIQELG
ncbi:MAG TPA: ABC transporter ATP-binding protein [Armatimonadota bacterium]